MEPTPYNCMKASPKVDQKLALDSPNRLRGAYYVVGGGVQDVLGGAVVHHEGVVTGGPKIVGIPYHGGALVSEYGVVIQELVDNMVI
jgi:hypothetical protein